MKKLIVLAALILIGLISWRIGGRLSSDALGMGLGVLFGVLAGVPTAMLMMASSRRRDEPAPQQGHGQGHMRQGQAQAPYGYPQPPVIVLAGNGAPAQAPPQNMYGDPYQGARPGLLPAPANTVEARQFRVVGEKEEWVDEW